MHTPTDYFPIVIQSLVAAGFVVVTYLAIMFLGPKVRGQKKEETFECGIPVEGDARMPVSIKYFMTAILFVLFDVEIIFFYPYAVNFRTMGWEGFWAVLMFVVVFMLGFIYILKKGALEWDN